MNTLYEKDFAEVIVSDRLELKSVYEDSFESITNTKSFSDFSLTSYLMTEWNDFSLATNEKQ